MQISDDIKIAVKYLYGKRWFITSVIFILATSFYINRYLFENVVYKMDKDMLIVGDSQFLYGLNPGIINNSVNTSQAAEPFVISFFKLKYIYKYNRNIKSVVITTSPIHFTHTFDDMFTDKSYSAEMFNRSIYIVRFNDLKLFSVGSFIYWENFIRYELLLNFRLIKNFFISLFNSNKELDFPFIGGFKERDRVKLNIDIDRLIDDRFEGYTDPRGIVNAQYIDSIAKFTSSHNMKLYIVGMPLLRDFYSKVPIDVNSYLDSKISSVQKYGGVKFIPCYTMCDDTLFADFDHLNRDGAAIISKYLNEKLSE